MPENIKLAILEDHQGIIDGYHYRFRDARDIDIVATLTFGDQVEPTLNTQPVDVLILDVQVPTSPENPNPFPILHLIPEYLQNYPNTAVLVVSMHDQRTLIESIMDAGASGYVLKDDRSAIRQLPAIVRIVANDGIYLSQTAYKRLLKRQKTKNNSTLSPRQVEALSLCAAYPDKKAEELAKIMKIGNSTFRNLLSRAYQKLGVHNRASALAKARRNRWILPE